MKGFPDSLAWRSSAALSSLTPYTDKRQSLTALPSFSKLRQTPTGSSSPAFSFEITLLNILQGHTLQWDERALICGRVGSLNELARRKLVDFIQCQKGAAQSAIEGNACKAFNCTREQLADALHKEHGVERLLAHWENLLFMIIPTLESILYPLATSLDTFSIRRTLLRCFRDFVLLRLFESIPARIPRLEHLIFTILFETDDDSTACLKFKAMAESILGQ